MSEKIKAQIKKLELANGKMSGKLAINTDRIRSLVGKLAGVKPGDVVTWKGERYQVTQILSDAMPAKGLPVLSGLKLLKNGNAVKREVEIKGAWKSESAALGTESHRGRKSKAVNVVTAKASARKGRTPEVAKPAARVSKRAALAAVAPEGTA